MYFLPSLQAFFHSSVTSSPIDLSILHRLPCLRKRPRVLLLPPVPMRPRPFWHQAKWPSSQRLRRCRVTVRCVNHRPPRLWPQALWLSAWLVWQLLTPRHVRAGHGHKWCAKLLRWQRRSSPRCRHLSNLVWSQVTFWQITYEPKKGPGCFWSRDEILPCVIGIAVF